MLQLPESLRDDSAIRRRCHRQDLGSRTSTDWFSPSRVVRPSGLTRLVALGTTASADSCSRTGAIAGRRPRRCRRARATGLPE
jgi:hypothetical protein